MDSSSWSIFCVRSRTTGQLNGAGQFQPHYALATLNPSGLDKMAIDARMAEEEVSVVWTSEVWEGDPDGDIALHFDGRSWMVKQDIITAYFSRIRDSTAGTKPVSTAFSVLSFFFWRLYSPMCLGRFCPRSASRAYTEAIQRVSCHPSISPYERQVEQSSDPKARSSLSCD